jgi:hypothetical protein
MKTQLLELAARYTRHCLYRWQHHMGDFSGSPACCNLWDLIQAALGEASKSPQVPFGLVLSTVCAEMEFKRKLVQLYPCPCCAVWNVDEWWLDDGRIVKAQRVMEVLSVEEAAAFYLPIFGGLKRSVYDPATDSYSSRDEDCNFIVTGSHGLCSGCQTK